MSDDLVFTQAEVDEMEDEYRRVCAERDTLAEMVRRVNMRVFDDLLRVYIPSSGALSVRVAPDQAERFQRVLDKLGPKDGERDAH